MSQGMVQPTTPSPMYKGFGIYKYYSRMGNKCCCKKKVQSGWEQWSLYSEDIPSTPPPTPLYDRLVNLPPDHSHNIPWRESSNVPPDLDAMNAVARSHWLHPPQLPVQANPEAISVWAGYYRTHSSQQ